MSIKYENATWNIIEKFFYDNPEILTNMSNSASNYAQKKMTIDFQVSKIVDFLEKNK